MKPDFSSKIITILIIIFIYSSAAVSQDTARNSEPVNSDQTKSDLIKKEKMYFETDDLLNSSEIIMQHIRESFPVISEKDLSEIVNSKTVVPVITSDTLNQAASGEKFKVSFDVPENFLVDSTKILWELNIPEFKSRIYQLFNGKQIYIDTWPNVVGTINDKTYTGNFQAYKVRNWPFYKDPDPKKAHLSPTPPGKGNPLGLFVVHYDQNSLRYFHGTNKNNLLYSKMRNLSHGCVRNDNDNIQKMKEFLIKKVIKSEDLTGWLDSRKTLVYDFTEEDKFPVKIIYKTYEIDKDENGFYFTLFKDIYNYSSGRINETLNDPGLIYLTNKENLTAEYRNIIGNDISDDKLSIMTEYLLNKGVEYERYYIDQLKSILSIGF
ncbi:MAG: L,D-transpeptidase family protein [Ignavibacteria bacterium]|nr:L,D-transpeptidase family protein [Ignavibacteria bacterium]